jgi:hypothetical protein
MQPEGRATTRLIVILSIIALSAAAINFAKPNNLTAQDLVNLLSRPQGQSSGTSTWRIYQSDKLHISIHYPSQWTLDASQEDEGLLSLKTSLRQQAIDSGRPLPLADFSIKMYAASNMLPNNQVENLSFSQWIASSSRDYGWVQTGITTLDGTRAYEGTAKAGIGVGGGANVAENRRFEIPVTAVRKFAW